MARFDPHSYADSAQPAVRHLDLRADADFDARVLRAEATLTFDPTPGATPLDLDTRDLTIGGATLLDGTAIPFSLFAPEPILGSRLRLDLPAGADAVRIRYTTSPLASALQWLTPGQTAGKCRPFLFSQCQAIHARSIVPLQDTPRRRIRYRAELTVPPDLVAVMAASSRGRREASGRAVFAFEMPQPIPPYLLALAVGDLESRDLGPRSRVWAEPAVVEAAAWEFAGVDGMLRVAEGLFGPYDWERFDILTMPPSFPYGGMENPRLTFLTPTLLAGDRSLVSTPKRNAPRYFLMNSSNRARPAASSSARRQRYPFSYGTLENASSGSTPASRVRRHCSWGRPENRSSSRSNSRRPTAAWSAAISAPSIASRMRRSANTVHPSFSQKCSASALVTRFPVHECASSCATTFTSDRSPQSSVGVRNVRRGFSMPP